MSSRDEASPERVLVLTPTGRDAEMVRSSVLAAGLHCEICEDFCALLSALEEGAGVAVVAQEALKPGGAEALLALLGKQEPWSDVPVLLLTLAVSKRVPNREDTLALLGHANVTLLQRPLLPHLFLSAVRSAVRARRRQYQMRDLYRELSRAVELGELFVSILGHDLRTPLAAIRTSAELIVRGVPEPRALGPAKRIVNSSDRMTRMIEQLLDYVRARKGQGLSLRIVPADLGQVTCQVLQELRAANPEVRLDLSDSGRLEGRWDPDRLSQVVSNLVGNAIRHGTPGQPIGVDLNGREPGTVGLTVRNRGAISLDAMPTLFEPFKRTASTARESGLGLGLFIAREIVRAHGGDLTVRVADGDVTVFHASLPREAPSGEIHVITPAPATNDAQKRHGP